VGFEPTTLVFQRAKVVHTLDRAATLIGPDIIRMIKFRGCRELKMHEKEENAYKILVVKSEAKIPLGRPQRRWEDNIKMDVIKISSYVL
jgi:hypothetical protein